MQFLTIEIPVLVSGSLYACSMPTADVLSKIQSTKFNSEDDEDINYFSNVVQSCTTVLIIEQGSIQNDFACISSQGLCH